MTLGKKLDKQGRLLITKELLELSGISSGKVALCFISENQAIIKMRKDVSTEDAFMYTRLLDDKGRICLPTEFRVFPEFVAYVKNRELTIEGVG